VKRLNVGDYSYLEQTEEYPMTEHPRLKRSPRLHKNVLLSQLEILEVRKQLTDAGAVLRWLGR
jgi:hypothetical protein